MGLGVGEAGGFPGGIKAVAEWFPKKERAFATGLFNAGTNIGAIVTPLVVPGIVLAFGWQMAFIVTGVAGLVWLPIWLLVYRPRASRRSVCAPNWPISSRIRPIPSRRSAGPSC
jgi:ACS family hexuronate transporter-like MFS transporter